MITRAQAGAYLKDWLSQYNQLREFLEDAVHGRRELPRFWRLAWRQPLQSQDEASWKVHKQMLSCHDERVSIGYRARPNHLIRLGLCRWIPDQKRRPAGP